MSFLDTPAKVETLFDPEREHDACGVGFVANENAKPSRDVIVKALIGLGCQQHRGGVACDSRTGDGAGIKAQIPQKFFKDEYAARGGEAADRDIGVGMFFMPRHNGDIRRQCKEIIENALREETFSELIWRDVPTDPSVLGEMAEKNMGHIAQIMFPLPENMSITELEHRLYIARHKIMRRVDEQQLSGIGSESLYIPSLSASSIIYKGMTLATQLGNFYTDLQDPRFESAYAIFHQRFSTNTTPKWQLAHPFHFLAHNGEVNTVAGNRDAMGKHEARLARGLGNNAQYIVPVIIPGRSDSADLSASVGFWKNTTKLSLSTIKYIHVPPAVTADDEFTEEEKGLFEYIDSVTEPWDGPATLMMSDESMVLAGGDRNGLRPIRLMRTSDGILIVTSEVGSVPFEPENLIESDYLAPGEMIALDLECGKVLRTKELKQRAVVELGPELKLLERIADVTPAPAFSSTVAVRDDLLQKQVSAGYSEEWIDHIITPQAENGKEAIGSMGDDTPLAVLSNVYRPFSHYFRQQFAQVTNPPIDPIRERHVVSLITHLGSLYDAQGQPSSQNVIRLQSPILSNTTFEKVRDWMDNNYAVVDCTFPVHGGAFDTTSHDHEHELRRTINTILEKAERAAREGRHLILSDEETGRERAGVPMILVASAVHNRLIQEGLRHVSSINIRTAECFDPHYAACLIGCGADTVNSYLVEETILDRFGPTGFAERVDNYLHSIESGLLKIMSKMGIAPVSSYRGARLFDAMGLSKDVVEEFFPGMKSPIGGLTLSQLQKRIETLHAKIYDGERMLEMPAGSFFAIRERGGINGEEGERHAITPETNQLLFDALESGDFSDFIKYSKLIHGNAQDNPVAVRDLLDFNAPKRKIQYSQQDRQILIKEILREMVTGAMSHGSISKPAHEILAQAMNSIGAKSDCGEGGEDPARFGTDKNSAIKQVASGRFGVTIEYLNAAQELEIKVSQGAKPGEGGQLPGFKVQGDIPRLRFVEPGTELVSPPPHHDIYSIEDLAQLIHDLKQANPRARVRVKLVSETGVGTVAAGVAKAGADVIHIAGNSGGTGASPESSIKFAGNPWELGLSEAQQALVHNNLRDRVKLVTDGGMRTGRDVVIAALLGAEEYSFGTNALIAEGCVLTRQCHTNKCPVGIATQDPVLMQAFKGTPEGVVRYFEFVAAEAADIILNTIGKKHLVDVIGRADKLKQVSGFDLGINLEAVLARPNPNHNPTRNAVPSGLRSDYLDPENCSTDTLEGRILREHTKSFHSAMANKIPVVLETNITNQDRTFGAGTSSLLARSFEKATRPKDIVTLKARGFAGQTFGGFGALGTKLELTGMANDYVGKGLSGGTIVVRPDPVTPISANTNQSIIIGNTCFYGATEGEAFVAGRAASRFAIRNSGARIVVEGIGTNGCNYMTGGEVIILGKVGRNFANAMTGGQAFVYDEFGTLEKNTAPGSVIILMPTAEQKTHVKERIERHVAETGSAWARSILQDWERAANALRFVVPKLKAPANQNQVPPLQHLAKG